MTLRDQRFARTQDPAGAIALLAETVTDAADDPDAVTVFSGRISKESARPTELVHHLIDLQKAQSPQSDDRCAAHFRAGCGTRRHRRQSDPSRLPPCGYPTECQRTVSTQ